MESNIELDKKKIRIKELEEELSLLKLGVEGNVNVPINQKLKSRDYSNTKYVPKNPLGMKDYKPDEMAIREEVMGLVKKVFKNHGAVEIETPVIELKETLTGKYGEDSKLIYDLKDQGGEILALRYDLTVPFARYCAQHNIESLKRYHIARVYRRDRPVLSRGRFREFYQCDLDIAGIYHDMTADAECLKIVSDILKKLSIKFKIKVNHRKLLDGIFNICGVPNDLLRPICSAVDKLDKLQWAEVKAEMLQKGIDEEQAENIWSFVKNSGGQELVHLLLSNNKINENEAAKKAVEEIKQLMDYLSAFGLKVGEEVIFDLSLARGLDYYTGMIFEAIALTNPTAVVTPKEKDEEESAEERLGSIAAGGRYDGLVGMFKKNKKEVPCVGLSLGIERIFVIYANEVKNKKVVPTQVLVCTVGAQAEQRENLLKERMKILDILWSNDIAAETVYKLNPKALTQFQQCEDEHIPIALIVAPEELSKGLVKIRRVFDRDESDVAIADLVPNIRAALALVPKS